MGISKQAWENLYKKNLTSEDIAEIKSNLSGFFGVLKSWNDELAITNGSGQIDGSSLTSGDFVLELEKNQMRTVEKC